MSKNKFFGNLRAHDSVRHILQVAYMRPSFSARNELALSVLNFILHDIKQEFLSIRIAIFSLQRCCLLRLFFSCEHYTLPIELGLVRCCELLKKVKTDWMTAESESCRRFSFGQFLSVAVLFFVQLCDVGFHNWNSLCFSTPFFISTSHSFSTLVDGAECALSWQKLSLTFIACVPPPRGGWQLFFLWQKLTQQTKCLEERVKLFQVKRRLIICAYREFLSVHLDFSLFLSQLELSAFSLTTETFFTIINTHWVFRSRIAHFSSKLCVFFLISTTRH